MTTKSPVFCINDIDEQFSEDPTREPVEKETAIHLEGGAERCEVTSFKRTVYAKLLRHPEFEVKWLNVRDEDGRESTVESLETVRENPTLTVIGATGTLPVGALSIGVPRQSDSHAQIVKT